ncbi:melanophilin a [Electrophorus electricus]|uniref:melanophilin a n=1 Tax=Electrophorus electricus TaxID=8005 RepID=UPI0015CFD68E|nr:melanophilin a [Electrophorus electricus]
MDLSRLTDEEVKHVWEVIQRDLELRKKEQDRLGELQTRIEKDDAKRKLLGSWPSLSESHCLHCLQPFRFLVNRKRQCQDCQLYACGTCSRYSGKERGWVCEPCRAARVLKIGTLTWYHDNVHSRFKRFGGAKVLRSLRKRLSDAGRRDNDTSAVNGHSGHDDEDMDTVETQRYMQVRKTRRLLSVHPLDLDMDNYSSHSRRHSVQHSQDARGRPRGDTECRADACHHHHHHHHLMNRRRSLDPLSMPDDAMHFEHRMVRARSLSKINAVPQRSAVSLYMDTSEDEDGLRGPIYQPHPPRRSHAQENVSLSAPQINELSKRMSAIETLLNHLEEKMMNPPDQLSAGQLEEENLKKKLDELMSDRALSSDEEHPRRPAPSRGPGVRGRTIREQDPSAPMAQKAAMSSSSDDEIPTEAQKRSTAAALCDITIKVLRTLNAVESVQAELAPPDPPDRPQLGATDVKKASEAYRQLEENLYLTAGKSFNMERKLRLLEQNATKHYLPLTDSELSELEEQLSIAAAKVQSTESEVSDIENKIAALSVSGLSMDKAKKKASSIQQRRKMTQDISINRVPF